MKFNETETLLQNEYCTSTEEFKFGNMHLCYSKIYVTENRYYVGVHIYKSFNGLVVNTIYEYLSSFSFLNDINALYLKQ